jgi:regulator of sigma E protease
MAYIAFILILIVLILVHELGHFSIAKFFKIRVDEFGIGFPPRLFAKKFGETVYSFNVLLFGGFVKIFGENNEAAGNEPRSFVRKNRFIQTAVLLGGIVFNLVFAWLVLSVGYMVGMPSSVEHTGLGQVQNAQATLVYVLPGSPADKAGLKENDIVLGAQTGTAQLAAPMTAQSVTGFIAAHGEESVVLQVQRNGTQQTFLAKPIDGIVTGHKAIGVQLDDVGVLRLAVPLAFVQGGILFWEILKATVVGLLGFFGTIAHGTADYGQVAGPIGIAGIGASAVRQGFAAMVMITALISINLAVINVLPIPGLDGGRLLFVIIEGILRKPISEKLTMGIMLAGFAALILLMLVISYHDILRLVHH